MLLTIAEALTDPAKTHYTGGPCGNTDYRAIHQQRRLLALYSNEQVLFIQCWPGSFWGGSIKGYR